MNCKHYQTEILESALENPEGQDASRASELQRHLAACPACREAFRRERELAARIDGALKLSLTAEPSPRMAAQVYQQIAGNARRSEAPFWAFHAHRWTAVAILCALLLISGALWRTHHIAPIRSRTAPVETARVERSRTGSLEKAGLEGRKNPRLITRRLTVGTPLSKDEISARAATKTAHRSRRIRTKRRLEQRTPQVLVPKDEMALVLQLYYETQTGVIDGASLVATPPGFKREPDGTLVSAPIEIKPIEIAKLKIGPVNLESDGQRANVITPAHP